MRRALLAALLAGLAGSCGYRAGLVGSEELNGSIGVEIFTNDSREPDIEKLLHERVTAAVRRLVDAPLVSPELADTVIRGRIVEYRRRNGIRNSDNDLLETGVRITLEARLLRTDDPDFVQRGEVPEALGPGEAPSAPDARRYTAESGFRTLETLGEASARDRVLRNLADHLVLDLLGRLVYEVEPSAP